MVYFYRVLDEVEGRWTDVTPDLVQRMAGHAVLCGLVAVGVLFVTSPYAFLDFGDFVEDLTFQTRMAGNAGLVPFTIQYVIRPRSSTRSPELGMGAGDTVGSRGVVGGPLHRHPCPHQRGHQAGRPVAPRMGGAQLPVPGEFRGPLSTLHLPAGPGDDYPGREDVGLAVGQPRAHFRQAARIGIVLKGQVRIAWLR